MNAFLEKPFCIVASTESIDFKLLMIMWNMKQTKMTYMEFTKKTFFRKKGYSAIIWGLKKVWLCILRNVWLVLVLVFLYFSLLWDTWRQQPEYEIRRNLLRGAVNLFFFSFHMQGFNALKRKMLFNEGMNFVVEI